MKGIFDIYVCNVDFLIRVLVLYQRPWTRMREFIGLAAPKTRKIRNRRSFCCQFWIRTRKEPSFQKSQIHNNFWNFLKKPDLMQLLLKFVLIWKVVCRKCVKSRLIQYFSLLSNVRIVQLYKQIQITYIKYVATSKKKIKKRNMYIFHCFNVNHLFYSSINALSMTNM